jgi:4-oxalomesaconate tautomerase
VITNVDNCVDIWQTARVTDGVSCMILRGGSSKGAYFLAHDLPSDALERDALLLRIMGSPDARQIDGIGGAHPLTSKVAVIAPSADESADIDYLFLQVGVGEPVVSDRQNCGNLLAGVAPFAIERGLVAAPDNGEFSVRIKMLNTGSVATARLHTAGGMPIYEGETAIASVPGTAAAIALEFEDIAGGSTGSLLPTGNTFDDIDGVCCTLVDNGMPVVVMAAEELGVTGYESCEELEQNQQLRAKLEAIRLDAGQRMNLGDVTSTTIPKLTMVAPPRDGGHLCTRTFIPHRCHDAIGVLGAVSVATAALLPGSPAHAMMGDLDGDVVQLEHPTGVFDAVIEIRQHAGGPIHVQRAGIIRTARKLMDGTVFPRAN